MTLAAAAALVVAVVFAIALVAPRKIALVLAAGLLAVPAFVEAPPLARFVVSLFTALAFIRTVDLVRTPIPRFSRRFLHLVAYVDTRRLTPCPPALDLAGLLGALPWALVALGALYVGLELGPLLGGVPHRIVRWAACVAFSMALFEVAPRLFAVAWRRAGFLVPKLHDMPWRARSLREFWGERWNLTVGDWLRFNLYDPLRPRVGPNFAMAAAFAGSGLVHAYVVWVALGTGPALVMAGFFVVQGLLLVVERIAHVSRWNPRAANLWTVGAIVVTSPLFLEPMLRLVEPYAP